MELQKLYTKVIFQLIHGGGLRTIKHDYRVVCLARGGCADDAWLQRVISIHRMYTEPSAIRSPHDGATIRAPHTQTNIQPADSARYALSDKIHQKTNCPGRALVILHLLSMDRH